MKENQSMSFGDGSDQKSNGSDDDLLAVSQTQ